MKFPNRHIFLVSLFACVLIGCSKNGATLASEDNFDEDTVSYPLLMFLTPERKGLARLFSNGKEIQNLEYAKSFVADADLFYFYNSEPPRKIQFESKDTVGIFYSDEPALYGMHKEDTTFLLHSRYPFASPDNVTTDTSMFYYKINPETEFYHHTITAYGDLKEFRIPIFSFKHARYYPQQNDDTTPGVTKTSFRFSAFKESHIQTLGPLDTLGIQEYELVYRPR
jgi:hypothetical protein